MMLFSNQIGKSAKPRFGADVPGLAALAKRAPIPGERERAAAIGALLFKIGGGVALRCANPNAVRPPAPDDRQASRIATGKFISPPILRAIAKTGAVVPQGSDTFVEPQPRPSQADIDFLHSPEVSNDLRANLIDAVRRRVAIERTGDPQLMYQWSDSITDMQAAIADLIDRLGPPAAALSRLLHGDAAKRAFAARGRIAKFFDVEKHGTGDDGDDFDWRSYGRTQLHGHFDAADRKVAELWRGTIARVPSLASGVNFRSGARR
jgi:hypothetical protein